MSKSRCHKKLCFIIKTSKQPNLIAGDGRGCRLLPGEVKVSSSGTFWNGRCSFCQVITF